MLKFVGLLLFTIAVQWSSRDVNGLPYSTANGEHDEIVVAKEIVHYTSLEGYNSTAALVKLNENRHASKAHNDNEATLHAVDDLIIPLKKSAAQQINFLTSAEDEALQASDAVASASLEDDEFGTLSKNWTAPIDLSEFIALIPTTQVKAIARNYYEHDAEVQRAYAFLASPDFVMLRQRLLAIREVQEFLVYLNSSGLNVLGLFEKLVYFTLSAELQQEKDTTPHSVLKTPTQPQLMSSAVAGPRTATQLPAVDSERNEIVTIQQQASLTDVVETTTPMLEFNGLHGMVDSMLELLPQDQILSTFFEKLENCGKFAQLVESIGSLKFTKLLSNMERSVPLRNIIYTLHNQGIYVTPIVDSLKEYFFLGTL